MTNDNFDFIKIVIFILIAFGGAAISIIKKVVDTVKKQNGSDKTPSLDDVMGSFKAKKTPKRIKKVVKKTAPVAPVYEAPVEYEQPIIEEPVGEQTAYTIKKKSVRTGSLKHDLRKAMVLHEILKPPKGLSDDF